LDWTGFWLAGTEPKSVGVYVNLHVVKASGRKALRKRFRINQDKRVEQMKESHEAAWQTISSSKYSSRL